MVVVSTKRKFYHGLSVREKAQEYEEGLGFTFFSIDQSGGLDKNELCSLVSVGEKEEEEERVRVTVAPPPHHGPHGCPRLASEPTTFKRNGTQSFKIPPKKVSLSICAS